MDAERLRAVSGFPCARRRARRIQRQIHVGPDGAQRRLRGDAGRPCARELSQLLPARRALVLRRNSSGRGWLMANGTLAAYLDFAPREESFRDAALAGLTGRRKAIPCRFLYDAQGSALFERICDLPEYYVTRAETALLAEHAGEIAARIGPRARLIEFGSGASTKVRLLLDALDKPSSYVPIDISGGMLHPAASAIAADFPALKVIAVCADYMDPS